MSGESSIEVNSGREGLPTICVDCLCHAPYVGKFTDDRGYMAVALCLDHAKEFAEPRGLIVPVLLGEPVEES